MRQSKRIDERSVEDVPSLAISPEKVCFVVIKAREFDAKDVVTEPDAASNPCDDKMIAVLEDHRDDPVLETFISNLSEDEQIDLVTIAWLGRDDYTLEDWFTLRQEAARAHGTRATHTADYLLGMPLLFPVKSSRPDGSYRPGKQGVAVVVTGVMPGCMID
jgi:uncharacterized protein DUF3775